MNRPKLSLRHRPPRLAVPAAHGELDLDDLLAAIREIVREELRVYATTAGTEESPTFVDKHTSGIGPSVFLAAARAGEFETFRVGKRFVAREADVRAYIERQRVRRTPAGRLDELDVQVAGRVKRASTLAGAAATNSTSAPPKKVG